MFTLVKKSIIGFILASMVLSLTTGPVFAQESPAPEPAPVDTTSQTQNVGGVNITPADIRAAIAAPTPNLANTTAYIFYTISVIMTGTFRTSEVTASGPTSQHFASRPDTLAGALSNGGLVGGIAFMTAEMVKQPPASASLYAADVVKNSRFGSPVYAQGVGFGALNPILGTWKAFRDVSYYLLTVMFIVTGFLILIRQNVSGNVAVTVQNALPRLVLTLIFITFSYAIAGLVVDVMYLALYFIINIFQNQIFQEGEIVIGQLAGVDINAGTPQDIAFNMHLFEFIIKYIFGGAAFRVAESISSVITDSIGSALGPLFNNDAVKGIFDWLIAQIFSIIFAVAIFIAMFRTFFSLVMSYAGFVLNVVLAPFILLQGAIPGKDPFKDWLKNLIAGLAPFVVVVFMLFMSLALTGIHTREGIGYDPENPGQSGLRLPLILAGDIDADAFIGILAMGFMLMLPEAVKLSKTIVGAKGGPLDEFKDKALSNLKQGWTGAGPVPGAKTLVPGALGGMAVGALGGAAAGAYAGQQFAASKGGGRFARVAAGVGAGTLGALGGIAAAPVTGTAGMIVTGGAPMFGSLKKKIEPLVQNVDKGLTVARNYGLKTGGRDNLSKPVNTLPFESTSNETPIPPEQSSA